MADNKVVLHSVDSKIVVKIGRDRITTRIKKYSFNHNQDMIYLETITPIGKNGSILYKPLKAHRKKLRASHWYCNGMNVYVHVITD